ncbi:Bifunctional protein GlmU [Candidatus Methanobinarius endosymbioticus]|uniref:Bifunctional protein GlmU n=1 Tax=Candidatus Methanobinarius endosymbioticus TaxID=2006182 RepID=A0A366MA78_9EURY|nr:Bifunctional protein GlmU [Candidatus Methanobinarius endosymbioticus]
MMVSMLVSSVITAAGQNFRMKKSQKLNNIPLKNKLLLLFPSYINEFYNENIDINNDDIKTIDKSTIIETTINNVLSSKVDECIIVLGHYAEEIEKIILNISDSRIKIIKNDNVNVSLSHSLLNGLKHCTHDYVLCLAGDQPTISSKTYENIIDSFFKLKNPEKSISILRRKNYGILDTAEGLGMPFITSKNQLINYLDGKNDNLNPLLRKIFEDKFCFHGIKESNKLELRNINDWNEYQNVLKILNSYKYKK